jgi:hypothetical protein
MFIIFRKKKGKMGKDTMIDLSVCVCVYKVTWPSLKKKKPRVSLSLEMEWKEKRESVKKS